MMRTVILGMALANAWNAGVIAFRGPAVETWQIDLDRAAGNLVGLAIVALVCWLNSRWSIRIARRTP